MKEALLTLAKKIQRFMPKLTEFSPSNEDEIKHYWELYCWQAYSYLYKEAKEWGKQFKNSENCKKQIPLFTAGEKIENPVEIFCIIHANSDSKNVSEYEIFQSVVEFRRALINTEIPIMIAAAKAMSYCPIPDLTSKDIFRYL